MAFVIYLIAILYSVIKPDVNSYFGGAGAIIMSVALLQFGGKEICSLKFITRDGVTIKIYSVLRYMRWNIPATALGWFGESFLLLAYGRMNGAEALGGIRVIQTVASVLNPSLIVTENWSTTSYANIIKNGSMKELIRKSNLDLLAATGLAITISIPALIWGDWLIGLVVDGLFKNMDWYLTAYVLMYSILFGSLFQRSLARASNGSRLILGASTAGMFVTLGSFSFLLKYGHWGFLVALAAYNATFFITLFVLNRREAMK
jgi:hypothetical protein